jgi:hypothetical protein
MKNNHIKVKIHQSVQVDIAQIATNLAEKNNEAQAELFNKFSTALAKRCEDDHNLSMQLSYIVDNLDIYGKQLIRELAAFIELKNLT